MKTINATSKQGARYLQYYKNSQVYSVKDAYKRSSSCKIAAEAACKRLMADEKGHDYKILNAGRFTFSAAWKVAEGLRVETAYSSYLIK